MTQIEQLWLAIAGVERSLLNPNNLAFYSGEIKTLLHAAKQHLDTLKKGGQDMSLSKTCPHCKSPNNPNNIYCWNCGGELFEKNSSIAGLVKPEQPTPRRGECDCDLDEFCPVCSPGMFNTTNPQKPEVIETPRTDYVVSGHITMSSAYRPLLDLCRQLERELIIAREQLATVKKETIRECARQSSLAQIREQQIRIDGLEQQMAAVEKDKENLAKLHVASVFTLKQDRDQLLSDARVMVEALHDLQTLAIKFDEPHVIHDDALRNLTARRIRNENKESK